MAWIKINLQWQVYWDTEPQILIEWLGEHNRPMVKISGLFVETIFLDLM